MLAPAQHLGRTSADHAKRRSAVSCNLPRTVGALNTVSHMFGQVHAEACGGSGKGEWRCWWHIIVEAKMSTPGSTRLMWNLKSMPYARRFARAHVGKGGWTRGMDLHALDCDVAQNFRSLMIR